jgi:hypothetical protein
LPQALFGSCVALRPFDYKPEHFKYTVDAFGKRILRKMREGEKPEQ